MSLLMAMSIFRLMDYFDWLRIIAALSVIFMHTAAGPLRAGINTSWHLLNVCTSLAFTAVPLFFMMSGYLLMTSRKTADISVLLRHRLPRLVVPLAGWTVVAVLWQLFLAHTLTPGAIRVQLVAALNGPVMVHFWYLYTLIALYVLSPILYGGIRTLGKSGRVYLFVLAAAVSVHTVLLTVLPDGAAQYVDLDIFGKLKIFGGHMATFVLGYLLGSYEKKIPNWLLVLGAAGNSIRTSRIRAPGLRSCWPRVFSCCASRRATGRRAHGSGLRWALLCRCRWRSTSCTTSS